MIALLLFIFAAVLSGVLHPGFSHFSNTVSELFSPGAPDRFLFSSLHTLFAVLLVLLGVGIMKCVLNYETLRKTGILGASAFIAMSLLNILTAF